jgi:hypothetical protein
VSHLPGKVRFWHLGVDSIFKPSSTQFRGALGHFCCWHKANIPVGPDARPLLREQRTSNLGHLRSAFDPKADLAAAPADLRRTRFLKPSAATVHRELVTTGCITFFATYSPI